MDKTKTKVLVAMSGGVDSSVAAALLKEQGYQVIGITMKIYAPSGHTHKGACCGIDEVEDAKRVAHQLDVPHYTLNLEKPFKQWVINNFIEEYQQGRTPNPCVRCNQFIKFNALFSKAKELGCEFVATGHYARIAYGLQLTANSLEAVSCLPLAGSIKLLKGRDEAKDQSYVLYVLTQGVLAHTLFPLGELTKSQVREIAQKLKLHVHDKEESQEICFVEDDDYVRFLKENSPQVVRPGPIVDKDGKRVGEHEGIAFYTLGQRKGIGAHRGEPKYVIGIAPRQNTVTIGDQQDLLATELLAKEVNYISGQAPAGPIEVTAKIRYNSPEAAAVLYPEEEDKAKVIFKTPQRAITPGQSVVFYQGNQVLGGGIIVN